MKHFQEFNKSVEYVKLHSFFLDKTCDGIADDLYKARIVKENLLNEAEIMRLLLHVQATGTLVKNDTASDKRIALVRRIIQNLPGMISARIKIITVINALMEGMRQPREEDYINP